MSTVSDIKSLGTQSAQQLKNAGILTIDSLLTACADKKGRKELAGKTSIEETKLLHWANRADLSRISGVSTQYGDLLESAGVDTVPELAQRNAENLHAKITQVNEEKHLVKKLPTIEHVQNWVAQAKDLPRVIHY